VDARGRWPGQPPLPKARRAGTALYFVVSESPFLSLRIVIRELSMG